MALAPVNALAANRISANYGTSVPPVRQAKKVDYEDQMVVPVKETANKAEAAFNKIAMNMQGKNNFYSQSLEGGSYGVVGSNIDVMA